MSLRLRIAIAVAAVVTIAVVAVGVSVFRAAEAELVEEVDLDLLARARLGGPDRPSPPGPGRFEFGNRNADEFRFERFISAVTFARILNPDGTLLGVVGTDFEAATDVDSLSSARAGPVLSDAVIDGARARVVTVELPAVGFLQIARPLGEIDQSLADLRREILLIGALAIAVSAAAAWSLATFTARPIQRLTDAASHVAATGDLDHPVDGSGGDEVGRLAGSFNAMLSALAVSRRQQHQLVMDASHELRTPLASLRTNVDVLSSGHDLAPDTRSAVLADIDAELGELTDLVVELVDLAADVRHDEALAPVHLAQLADVVIERARRRTGRSVTVEVEADSLIEGRPEALTRAIRNLVDNATKFSPADTGIRVTIDAGTVAVHDAGPGIASDERSRVFDRFHRLERTRALPGSGLGLAIVRQVVEAHGGDVFVGDSPEGGATVGFTVPTVDD